MCNRRLWYSFDDRSSGRTTGAHKAMKDGQTTLGSNDMDVDSPEDPSPSSASQPTKASSSSPSANTPSWIVMACNEALRFVFGQMEYTVVVDLWCHFESLLGEQDSKKIRLTSKGRPQQIPDWMQHHCQDRSPPPLGNLSAFSAVFKTWWRGMQPVWRMEGGAGELQQCGVPGMMKTSHS